MRAQHPLSHVAIIARAPRIILVNFGLDRLAVGRQAELSTVADTVRVTEAASTIGSGGWR